MLKNQLKNCSFQNCPCCSHLLVRQFRGTHLNFFCPSCHFEMPVIEERRIVTLNLSKAEQYCYSNSIKLRG